MGCVVIVFVLGLLALSAHSWTLALICFLAASAIYRAVQRS